MKRTAMIAGGVLALTAGIAVVAPFLVPSDVYKAQIETAASNALNRDVTLDGDVTLSVFPQISAEIKGVRVANPDGFSRENMIEAGALRGAVKWGPLITGTVSIAEIAFVDADVKLERRADGATNWTFGEASTGDTPDGGGGGGGTISAGIDRARLTNASLVYADALTGNTYAVTDLNLSASASSLAAPLDLDADGQFQSAPFDVSLRVDTLQDLLDGALADVEFNLSTNGGSTGYSGTVSLADSTLLNGTFELDARDLAALAAIGGVALPFDADAIGQITLSTGLSGAIDALAFEGLELRQSSPLLTTRFDGDIGLGGEGQLRGALDIRSDQMRPLLSALAIDVAPGETLQSFAVAGDIGGQFNAVSVTGLNAALDDIAVTGELGLNLAGARPKLTGDISTGALDLSPFLTSDTAQEDTAAGTGGWSDDPLDLEALKTVDTDIRLRADSLQLGAIQLSRPDLSARLANGRLTAQIAEMGAFGGQWEGDFLLDGSGSVAEMGLDLTGQTIQIADALQSLAGLSALTGLGQLQVDVTSRGNSLKALVEGLSGSMGSDIADGTLRGIDVGQLVQSRDNIVAALTDGSLQMALSQEAETDFASLIAGLNITNGVADLAAFQLDNPVVSISGSGQINLSGQTLDISLVPSIDTSAQGAGSSLQLNGIPIPFRVSGPWTSPGLSPDMRMLRSTLQADAVGRLSDQIGGDFGGVLGAVIGGGAASNAQPDATSDPAPTSVEDAIEDELENRARDALGGLFGRRNNADDEDSDDR